MDAWDEIAAQIARTTGKAVRVTEVHSMAGGCINETIVLRSADARYFVKCNRPDGLPMYEAEIDGLRALQQAGAVRVPTPLCCGTTANMAFLALEFIDMRQPSALSQDRLGRALADLHRVSHDRFGWHRDNTIGATPQFNSFSNSWVRFLREQRLGFQLRLAKRKGYWRIAEAGEQLLEHLDALVAGYDCHPSLLHGDLWFGNIGETGNGEPVIFDPAVYFGDREADIAMTELFGGFSDAFYDAYREAWPLAPGYNVRRTLYNLYHLLNHLNLFGGGYETQAERAIGRLLAEVR